MICLSMRRCHSDDIKRKLIFQKKDAKSSLHGFTLMEVLIALVILSIAFSTIFMSISVNSKSMTYLINKTASDWVAMNVITEIQLGLITLVPGHPLTNKEVMFNSTWYWRADLQPTINPYVSKIEIQVGRNTQSPNIINIVGYINNDI